MRTPNIINFLTVNAELDVQDFELYFLKPDIKNPSVHLRHKQSAEVEYNYTW